MHASNKITLENVKTVVDWSPLCEFKNKKIKIIAMASEAMMRIIIENVPDCADRSTALRSVREATLWSNTAIAIDQGET